MPKISEAARESKREAILAAALSCLAAQGYAGTSMRSIAEAAGLTKGGLYAYFDSKEAILLEVARRHMESALAAYAPVPGESALAQLHRVFERGAAVTESPEAAATMRAIFDLWAFGGALPAVREALAERHGRFLAAVAGVIRRGLSEGEFHAEAPVEHLAGLILAARDGITYHALTLGLPIDAPALHRLLDSVITPFLQNESERRSVNPLSTLPHL